MNDKDPIDIVRHFAGEIQNGRNLFDIFDHGEKEMVELAEELGLAHAGRPSGPDGIVGEAIDVMACMLDMIFVYQPDITTEEIAAMMLAKCEKWARRYKDNVHGDRTID